MTRKRDTDARFREGVGTDARFREGVGTDARFREGVGTDARFREGVGTDARFREGAGLDARFREDAMTEFYVNAIMNNTPTAEGSFALGKNSEVLHTNSFGFGGGFISSVGDVQAMSMLLSGITVGIQTVSLKLSDGSLPILPSFSTWSFASQLVARRTDVNGAGAANLTVGGIRRDAGVATTALIGATVQLMSVDEFGSGIAYSADVVNGALQVSVLGSVGMTIKWVTRLEITQTRT